MTGKTWKSVLAALLALMMLVGAAAVLADGFATEPADEDTEPAPALMAIVKNTPSGRINVRTEPSARADRVCVLDPGTQVHVLKNLGDWALIETLEKDKVGYMSTYYLDMYYEGDPALIPVVVTPTPTPTPTPVWPYPYYPDEPVEPMSWPITENTTMYVNTPNRGSLNMRARPDLDAPLINSYKNGTTVTVYHRENGWAYVQVGYRRGFMMLSFLSYTKPEPIPDPDPIGTATVVHPRGTYVNFRSTRTTDTYDNIICKIPTGTKVDVLLWDRWYTTVRYKGITGYIVTTYLEFDK